MHWQCWYICTYIDRREEFLVAALSVFLLYCFCVSSCTSSFFFVVQPACRLPLVCVYVRVTKLTITWFGRWPSGVELLFVSLGLPTGRLGL